jgi:hypothetical protein
MAWLGTDFVSNGPLARRVDPDGKEFVYVKSTAGVDKDTPCIVQINDDATYRGYFATAMADSVAGSITSYGALVGVPEEGMGSIVAGGHGWVQVVGARADVQFGAALVTGSVGHAVEWSIAAVGAQGSAYVGGQHQFGILTEGVTASTTANIFLTGKLSAGTS